MKPFAINKKRTTILFLCLFGAVRAMAQASLCGKVIDKDNQEPVPQATIQLFSLPDSTFAQGMVSGNDGVFRFSPLQKGTYLLKVSYIGYEPYWQQADLKANTRLDLKEILLKPASILLNETVIVAGQRRKDNREREGDKENHGGRERVLQRRPAISHEEPPRGNH